MPQLGGGNETVAVLVEMSQALDEIFGSVGAAAAANGLETKR